MKGIGIVIILWLAFSIMLSGPVVGTMEYGEGEFPLSFLLLMVPFSFLVLGVLLLTECYAVPRLLLHQKWGKYIGLTLGFSYLISFIELLIIRYFWWRIGIIPEEVSINWGGLALNSLSNCLMLEITLLALGVWRIEERNQKDIQLEERIIEEIEKYISAVKGRLNPENLLKRVGDIAEDMVNDPEKGEEEIETLCSELREDLYHLPAPPYSDRIVETVTLNTPFNRWLTSGKYRWQRFGMFQLILLTICFGAFFATPDCPEYSSRLGGFFILTLMFEILAGIVVFALFPLYRRRRRLKRFFLQLTVLAAIVLLPIIAERIVLFKENPSHTDSLFIFVTVLATLAAMLMIIFFLGGISATLLYADWVRETRRITLLKASTRRLEYASLKKQINPHFLFNVLNNAMIMASEKPEESRDILLELQRLLGFQLNETGRDRIALSDTLDFLEAYLSLEKTRKESFKYALRAEGETRGVETPTLIFIPFVENAVKFCKCINEGYAVDILFQIESNRLRFTCRNALSQTNLDGINKERIDEKDGKKEKGLGVTNTLRRLEIIYDSDFSYCAKRLTGEYVVEMAIPLKNYN